MPEDFYDFLEFCRTIKPLDPKSNHIFVNFVNYLYSIVAKIYFQDALASINVQLVGIYDLILDGLKTDYKLYYRYFYDPPEFQTVLKGTDETMLHFGYFRYVVFEAKKYMLCWEINFFDFLAYKSTFCS
jgi:hypothetical protein